MKTVEYFNSVAHKWDSMVYHNKNKVEYLLSILNIDNGNSVLDVGTGTGVLIPFLHYAVGYQGKIVGVDISDNMIKQAKKKNSFENVRFVNADVLNSELQKEKFDFVICYSMFPHFEDKALTIKTLSDYLDKNGKLAIFHSQSRNEINDLHKKIPALTPPSYLPRAGKIKKYYRFNGLRTIACIDNDDMFAIVGEKINSI